jgi:hypothetical protein
MSIKLEFLIVTDKKHQTNSKAWPQAGYIHCRLAKTNVTPKTESEGGSGMHQPCDRTGVQDLPFDALLVNIMINLLLLDGSFKLFSNVFHKTE